MGTSQIDALAAKSDEDLVKEARDAVARADRAEADASAWKWNIADRVVALRDRGWTQKRIAQALDFGVSTVHNYERVGRAYDVNGFTRPSFYEALVEQRPAIGRGVQDEATARRIVTERPEVIHEAIKNDPELAAKVVGEDPQVRGRLQMAIEEENKRVEKKYPMGDSTPREPLHWMLLKLVALGLGHDRFIKEEGDRCINLSLELRTAGGVILETNIAKLTKFREALLAETVEERAELLAQALKMSALKKKDPDEAFAELLGGCVVSVKRQRATALIQFLTANRGQQFGFADACSRSGVPANQSTRSALNRYGSEIAETAGLYLLFPCPENNWMVGIADHEEDWILPQLHLRKIMRGLARREAQGTSEARRQLPNFDPAPRAVFDAALDLEDDIARMIARRDRLIDQAIALL